MTTWNKNWIYHSMTKEQLGEWQDTLDKEQGAAVYRHATLESEGFIHLSKLGQMPWVKDRFYRNTQELNVMVVDPQQLSSKLVYEGPVASPELLKTLSGDATFPHIYGYINQEAIVAIVPYVQVYIQWLITHYDFKRLPVEGTFYKSTYQGELKDGVPEGTGMIGMYAVEPMSVSCFHKLTRPEMWHFYGGDPLELILLHPDGTDETIILGTDLYKGHQLQYVIPAGVWQAGRVKAGGAYSLFGCTLAPGFTPDCFEGGLKDVLSAKYPNQREAIEALSVNGDETVMPDLGE